ncbi:MAG TPA: hypothetical protein VF508_11200, partial [Pyrinomonadaceae bacterium]
AFALGLAAAGLLPRRPAAPVPTAVATALAPARAVVTVRDTRADSDDDDGGPAVYEGRYVNYTYGFSVELPAGMVAAGSTPPAPNHGFGIDLDHPRSVEWNGRLDFPKSYVYADGSYNSAEWGGPDDAADSYLDYLREDGRNVRAQSRTPTRLAGLRAVRVVARYEEGGEQMVSDAVFAFRRGPGGEVSAVYTLALSTPLSKYERDRPALEALLAGWHLQPVE